jgi:hypothetical protein
MKVFLVFVVLAGACLLSLPHLQRILLQGALNQMEVLPEVDIEELKPQVPSVSPSEFQELPVENNVAGSVALP